jgi:biotin carboxylase
VAKILVPDYMGQQVLSGIRTLHYDGDIVDLAGDINKKQRNFFRSRAIHKVYSIPRPGRNAVEYVSQLRKILIENDYNLVIPFGLAAYHELSLHKEEFSKLVGMMIPDYKALCTANDKLKASELCKDLGVGTPEVYSNYEENDIESISNEVRYPVVVKARGGSGVADGLRYAKNKRELLMRIRK